MFAGSGLGCSSVMEDSLALTNPQYYNLSGIEWKCYSGNWSSSTSLLLHSGWHWNIPKLQYTWTPVGNVTKLMSSITSWYSLSIIWQSNSQTWYYTWKLKISKTTSLHYAAVHHGQWESKYGLLNRSRMAKYQSALCLAVLWKQPKQQA